MLKDFDLMNLLNVGFSDKFSAMRINFVYFSGFFCFYIEYDRKELDLKLGL